MPETLNTKPEPLNHETGVNLVEWNPDGFKIGLCDVAPADQSKALLCLANKYVPKLNLTINPKSETLNPQP